MLTNKQRKLNDFIIKEAGLELDDFNHVVDQDTGIPIIIKDKKVKYNNGPISRLMPYEIEFDPLNNPLLASELCTNHLTKLQKEGELSIITYGLSNKEKNTLGHATCICSDDKIDTNKYILDSLKYIGLIAAVNNTEIDSKDSIVLKSYDLKKPKNSRR